MMVYERDGVAIDLALFLPRPSLAQQHRCKLGRPKYKVGNVLTETERAGEGPCLRRGWSCRLGNDT